MFQAQPRQRESWQEETREGYLNTITFANLCLKQALNYRTHFIAVFLAVAPEFFVNSRVKRKIHPHLVIPPSKLVSAVIFLKSFKWLWHNLWKLSCKLENILIKYSWTMHFQS